MKKNNIKLFLAAMILFTEFANATVSTTGNVDPDPSTWTTTTRSYIGKTANGSLDINGGSILICDVATIGGYLRSYSDVTGEVTVTGYSQWINDWTIVGNYGTGNLNISNGGKVTCNDGADIASNSTGIGTVTVTGDGSEWITDTHGYDWLYVGDYGTGSLNISDGGLVNSANSIIGNYGGSGATMVTDSGSQWINSNDLAVGFGGYGTLTIKNGGMVTVGGLLYIDDFGSDEDSFVHMAAGGMLALYDSNWEAGDDIEDFLDLAQGTDEICYNNGSAWDNIINATVNIDYTLEHITDGDLAGYTVLTVEICVVKLEEYAKLAAIWLQTGCGEPDWCNGMDFDHSTEVDIEDFSELVNYWLDSCPDTWQRN